MALLFLAAFYDRYWRVRGCFNELGRCFEPETGQVLLEQSGIVWGGLALVMIAATAINLVRFLKARRAAAKE